MKEISVFFKNKRSASLKKIEKTDDGYVLEFFVGKDCVGKIAYSLFNGETEYNLNGEILKVKNVPHMESLDIFNVSKDVDFYLSETPRNEIIGQIIGNKYHCRITNKFYQII